MGIWREIRRDGTRERRRTRDDEGGGGVLGKKRRSWIESRAGKKSQKDVNNINNSTSEVVWQHAAHFILPPTPGSWQSACTPGSVCPTRNDPVCRLCSNDMEVFINTKLETQY